MIIISQRKLLVNRKENNMDIEKNKNTLNQIDDDNTVEERYLNDSDLHESFYKLIRAESALVYEIDELITEYGYFSITDDMPQEVILKMFKLMFKMRKNAVVLSQAIEDARSCLKKDSEVLRSLKEQIAKLNEENHGFLINER